MRDPDNNSQMEESAVAASVDLLTRQDPVPALSDRARDAIVQAVAANADMAPERASVAVSFLENLSRRFSGGLEALLRPLALGTMGAAGVAGLVFGGLMGTPAAYTDLTPEEELAGYYAVALADNGLFDSDPAEGTN
ncbi:hypothetical protein [Parvularcula sp. IMCC14364]|uniref:hypothetical protein n=1 Tax=Parvularcula sp. IMCC14364 TaxID=3067902 RepID=UPI0027406D53|nr:hypothetical protein [Parvularcula sp. IMCC14364]